MPVLLVCSVVVGACTGLVQAEAGQLFDKLDLDRDGVVSRQEFVSCPLVRDKDGRIQHRELCADPSSALSGEEKNRLYDKISSGGQGDVTRKELNRFATPDGFAPLRF